MCVGYGTIAQGNPSGRPIEEGKKAGSAPPPDRVNNQEVAPQQNRQELKDQAQSDFDSQTKEINWRTRRPSKDDPFRIRMARLYGQGPKKGKPGNWEYIDPERHSLKLNPDGTAALGHGRDYYENLDNWYSKAEWDSFYGAESSPDTSANDDGVNL